MLYCHRGRYAEAMEIASSSEHRLESRNNIFVMATIYAAGGSTPVRIRNMSRGGALIEAAVLPPAGAPIRLSRGSLHVVGELMWVDNRRAGVRFAAPVAVAEWLPQGKRGPGQELIDELVHQARLGAVANASTGAVAGQPNLTFADELKQLLRILERAGEELASDSLVTAQHLASLQMIDGVAQALAKLVAVPSATAVPTKFIA